MKFPAMIATLALLAWTPATMAQVGQPRVDPPASFSDAELKSFAVIVVEVRRIADNYNPKLEAAQTIREQQQVELAATDEMTRAVTEEGMTVERYQEILKRSLTDPELERRIKQYVKDGKGRRKGFRTRNVERGRIPLCENGSRIGDHVVLLPNCLHLTHS